MRIQLLLLFLFGMGTVQANTLVHSEDFNTCGSETWASVSGAGNTDGAGFWNCTTWSGRTYMELYDGNGTGDEEWLISPAFNLDLYDKEYFSFEYDNGNALDGLTLFYSTDYSGANTAAAISAATWTVIPLDLYDIDNDSYLFQFLFQPSIDLSAIAGSSVYLAFRYVSQGNGTQSWGIDNARVTADYYAGIETAISGGSKCHQLKVDLHNLIKGHTYYEYTASSFDVWDMLYVTDRRLNDGGTATIVYDMYSDNPTGAEPYEFTFGADKDPGGSGFPEGTYYNREHVFPQSWWGGGTSPADTQRTDIHHVVPSDKRVNEIKSNYPMGETSSPTITSLNGCKRGNHDIGGYTGVIFEPIDEYKGDYARMLFYFTTRYFPYAATWEPEYAAAMDGNTYTFFDPWLLNMLIAWHEGDPVSQKEIDRNNGAYSMQGNRNPFIDHPEYVYFIWGSVASPGCPTTILPVELTEFRAEPMHDLQSHLQWTTASEEGSSHFVVEHSADGIRFDRVGEVSAARFSAQALDYGFVHKDALAGDNYYRLRMVDMDGSEEYSEVALVRHEGKDGWFNVYPNLVEDELFVDFETQNPATASLFDMQGRQVLRQDLSAPRSLNLGHLPSGVYLLRLESGALVETKRLFVK